MLLWNGGVLFAFCSILLFSSAFSEESQSIPPRTQNAYVALLYGDEFLLGVRVLGQSLKETGTKNDMVVLVSSGVTSDAEKLLQVSHVT